MKKDQLLTDKRKAQLLQFCKTVDIKFKNIELLEQAFHHRSLTNEKKVKNNERLEFLGDSVLGMVTAAYLYSSLDNPEGDLAKIKSAVVSEKSLAPIALRLGIDSLLEMGKGEEMTGGRTKPAILADCMEAIIGAYYLDSGYKASEKYVLSFIVPEIEKVLAGGMKDFKTQLQELYQKTSKECPVYELVSKSGPDHDQIFTVCVHLGNKVYGPCHGKTKKAAEQAAAKLAIEEGFNK
ncbi:ribonuclease III [Treponema sp. C6A8]|uniref:ribonuclease III n=1 Tax=Treponema sp. C6A8 TaxID=1410609 RepID=UPI00047F46C8|nr:ribonuclease III [Treponema sp. C6A8]